MKLRRRESADGVGLRRTDPVEAAEEGFPIANLAEAPRKRRSPASTFGLPASRLGDDDLRRELHTLYRTREDTFLNGSPQALRAHTDRMLELEREYAARFPQEAAPDPGRTRRGARRRSAGPR
ncbi:MAG TPA: DUF6158 family protein [Actinomycetota bacterium]